MSDTEKMIQPDMQEFSPFICEILKNGGSARITVTGSSMWPMLRDGIDSVLIEPANRKVKRWELPLYQRDDGSLVLHRVMKKKKGAYAMCGDNQIIVEWPVYSERIIGIAVEFTRKGKTTKCSNILYRIYAAIWSILRPYRLFMLKLYRKIIITKRWFSK